MNFKSLGGKITYLELGTFGAPKNVHFATFEDFANVLEDEVDTNEAVDQKRLPMSLTMLDERLLLQM